jgi:transposase-like protein
MNKRRRRSDAEWQQLIEQQEFSGLSTIAFCQQQGLSSKTFYKRRQRLQSKATDQTDKRFIKLQPQAPSAAPSTTVLVYRDSRLELPDGITAQWLAELMQALS